MGEFRTYLIVLVLIIIIIVQYTIFNTKLKLYKKENERIRIEKTKLQEKLLNKTLNSSKKKSI